jgi:hypothetical protein
MNKLLPLGLSIVTVVVLTACASSQPSPKTAAKLDVKQVCSVQSNGIQNVLKTAELYNAEAKKRGLEFMRLGMKTSQYIAGAKKAVASGAKTVDVLNKKKKKTGTVSTEYAAWRACSFAISALSQAHEAKTTWRLAVPGDGYKY